MTFANPLLSPWRSHLLHNVVQIAAFLFGALTLAVSSGYSYGPVILLLASLFICWRPSYWANMPREMKVMALIFLFYVVVQGLSIWLDGGRLREFDRPSRVLMALLILPLLSAYPARLISVLAGMAVGALIAGGIALYDKFYLGMERAFNDIMPIQSGNLSMTMGLLCLCGYFGYRRAGQTTPAFMMLLACAMGIIGSFLSGTRGGWVLLPLILLTIILHFRGSIGKLDKWVAMVFGLGLLALVAIPQTGVMDRVKAAQSDVVQYMDGGNRDTSVGIRFQLWSSAWDAFMQKPLFGWGNHGIVQVREQQYKAGTMSEYMYANRLNSHAHNQFLDTLAKQGVIGLLALLALLGYPFYLYLKSKAASNDISPLLLGIGTMTLFDYSLSQAFINHNSGITFFPMLFVMLISSHIKSNKG